MANSSPGWALAPKDTQGGDLNSSTLSFHWLENAELGHSGQRNQPGVRPDPSFSIQWFQSGTKASGVLCIPWNSSGDWPVLLHESCFSTVSKQPESTSEEPCVCKQSHLLMRKSSEKCKQKGQPYIFNLRQYSFVHLEQSKHSHRFFQ